MNNIDKKDTKDNFHINLFNILTSVDLSYALGHAGPFREVQHVLNLQNELGEPERHNFCH